MSTRLFKTRNNHDNVHSRLDGEISLFDQHSQEGHPMYPTTTGKLAEDVAGREETTEGPPDELYVEINEGTTSVPEDWEVEPGVPELEDAGDCVEVEVEERGTDVAAMFEFPPLESRREDSNGGSDSARALEIACANALVSGRETG